MDFGKHKQGTRKNWIVPVVKLATAAQELDELAVGQIGIVDIDNTGLVPKASFTDAPVDKVGHQFQIMQGRFANETIRMLHTITTDLSKRSVTFRAKDIVRWQGKKARKTASSQKVAIGWDGINPDKNFNVDKYNDTPIYVRFTGGYVNKIMGHTRGYRTSFLIPHECYDLCDTTEGNPLCQPGNKERAADELIKQINERMIAMQGTRPITQLFKAIKITSNTISGLVTFDTFEINVPDNGDNVALGYIQSQYPDLTIERSLFLDGVSTYRVIVPDGTATPAALSNDKITTLAYCSVCPTGYTATTPRKKFVVTLSHGAATTQFSGVTGYAANTPVSKSVQNGDVYFVYATNATNETTFANAVNTNGGSALFLGSDSAVCELTTPGTYNWAATESLTRASKTYKITLEDSECGTSREAELKIAYPGLTIVGDSNASGPVAGEGCLRNYTMTVFSDLTDTNGCFPDAHTFSYVPAPFHSIPWVEVKPETADAANVGVIFEGAVHRRVVTDEQYDFWAFDQDDVDGVHIEVSTHSNDYSKRPCKEDIPVTTLSYFEYPSGEGWHVRKMEEETAGYEMDLYHKNPMLRAVYGQQRFSKLEKYYDSYTLEVMGSSPANGAFDPVADSRYVYTFYFEVGRGKAFENAINGLIASSKADLLPVSL